MDTIKKLYIVCIEDEADVLDAILRDLAPFEKCFHLEGFGSAAEAEGWLVTLDAEDSSVALLFCDHVMPGKRGVDFMIDLTNKQLDVMQHCRKVLFTGQAGHQETIAAINKASIAHYQAKPWSQQELCDITKKLLTDYIIDTGINPLPYMVHLDGERLATHLHDQNLLEDA